MAKQRVVFDVRFRRIFEMICGCAYGFTNLSYRSRMNMPLELGMMLALGKNTYIASRRRYDALASISDLNHDRFPVGERVDRYEALRAIRRVLGQDDFDKLLPQEISKMLRSAGRNFAVSLPGG